MFLTLYQTKLMAETGSLASPPDPPPEYIPPLGASINTWPNIVKNKENIDFCVGQFYHLMNRLALIFVLIYLLPLVGATHRYAFRIHCLRKITGGPALN